MWPSVPAFRSFGNVACPSGAACELPHCIFSHNAPVFKTAKACDLSSISSLEPERAAKRLKIDNDTTLPTKQTSHVLSPTARPHVFLGAITSTRAPAVPKEENNASGLPKAAPNKEISDTLPRTAARPVSPPPKKAEASTPSKPELEVRLTPRKLQKEPATFARRLTMLKALHQFMSTLNDKLLRAVKLEIKLLHMSENELNKLAVDEEEKAAKDNGLVYENVLKQRLVALKKMTVEEWVKSRREAVAKDLGDAPKKPPSKRVSTGLTSKEEIIFLSTLTAPKESLIAHEFVTEKATAVELEETRAALASADFWEMCDRCGSRFQVFPDRREEDGALTTGGRCQHHWGKKSYPRRVKGQVSEGPKMLCCNEPMGSPPCTTHDTHVYKISGVNRMSVVMEYIETPENDKAEPHTAVCFDCEMGYTTYGLELIRLTVVSWPTHKPLVDVLVRPLGHVLDLNTRFSGVTAEQFVNAKPYDPDNPKPMRKDLRIVESPHAARDLFLAHVSPKTPVLGHALENDLNVIRLIHPTIVDTIILFPTRSGLPYRHGLKALAKMHLDLDIQQGGAAGHDSYEDAKTTGELIRFKVAGQWKRLKDQGWTIRDDGVHPPIPDSPPPTFAPPAPSMVGLTQGADTDAETAGKRARDLVDSDAGDEPPAKKQA